MNIFLVRVGADKTQIGGGWNGPVDSKTNEFVYASILEDGDIHSGFSKPFTILKPYLNKFKINVPAHLQNANMHLDPDFSHPNLTYGDHKTKGEQIRKLLEKGDKLIFYSGLKDIYDTNELVYAIIGVLTVREKKDVKDILDKADWDKNAHTRRRPISKEKDIVVFGEPEESGRLRTCIPIGERRNYQYRVMKDLLEEWGGVSVKDGFLQRSPSFPKLLNPKLFLQWFDKFQPELIHENNIL